MSRSAAAAVNHQTHPCLPTGMTLSHVIELIERLVIPWHSSFRNAPAATVQF